ncbi:MAG: hypothetical protein Q9M36_12330 [Sulfurovum sp.]|nr:hypothetical protein [Sulfurovum sp.]
MKKTILIILSILVVLGAIFTYILYTEGAFEARKVHNTLDVKPFEMKCEAGKCASGKCGKE